MLRGDGRVWIRYRHDKNGNLMGFATTDEIGSVTDMTKTKNEIRRWRGNMKAGRTTGGGQVCGGGGGGLPGQASQEEGGQATEGKPGRTPAHSEALARWRRRHVGGTGREGGGRWPDGRDPGWRDDDEYLLWLQRRRARLQARPGTMNPGGSVWGCSHKYYQMTLASVDEKYQIRAAAHTTTGFGVCSVLHAVCPRRC